MSVGTVLFVAFGVLALGVLLWRFLRWLSGAWEVIDDDQLHDKLTRGDGAASTALWLTIMRWFGVGPRQLTYRRDERGRFRKTRR